MNGSDFVTHEGGLRVLFEGCSEGDCIRELFEPDKGCLVGWFGMTLLDVI